MTPEERHRLFKQLEGYAIAGRFVLEELIGMGGMAAVFRARQSNVNRQVAIKLIPADDPLLVARFEREAGMVSQLSHPNNVTMFDFGHTEDGYVFLAMELLNGETLEQRILRGPIPLETTLHIAEQLCHALGEAHERGVVHRDVKPENIFLVAFQGDDAFVKVLDFGIAKSLDSRSYPSLTGEGRIIGTPRYMSPEQILGDDIDQRSDIYSLGCVLYQMLAGQPPFDAENSATLMLKHAQDMPPEFSDVAPSRQVPKHIEGIVRRMLAKTPGDRPASLEFVRQELMTEVSPDTDRATSDVETPESKVFTGIIVLSVVMTFLLIVGAALHVLHRSTSTPPAPAVVEIARPPAAAPVSPATAPVPAATRPPAAAKPSVKVFDGNTITTDDRSVVEIMFPEDGSGLAAADDDLPKTPEDREALGRAKILAGDLNGALRACEGVNTPGCFRISGTAYQNLGQVSQSCAAFAMAGMRPDHCN